MTPKRPTAPDCITLLDALEAAKEATPDGWLKDPYHLNVMVHSRANDLRKLGYIVEMRRFGTKDYRYRLVDPADADGQLRITA